MRLIYADELKKADFQDYSNTDVITAIDNMPTAYDKEKVVEQLEKATVIGADCVGDGFDCIPTFKAIEIVKGGGVNE